jgi:hypothetical protein
VAVAHGGGFIEDEGTTSVLFPMFHPAPSASPATTMAVTTPSDVLLKHCSKENGEFSKHSHHFLVSLYFCDL